MARCTVCAGLVCALGMLTSPAIGGTTQRASVDSGGKQANGSSGGGSNAYDFSISSDGRFIAFASLASNLVGDDTNGVQDVFVRDRVTGVTERVSVGSDGQQGNGLSRFPRISPDGRYVVFVSNARNFAPSDTNAYRDVFIRDRLAGTTELVSIGSDGQQGNDSSGEAAASVSADGRYVAFASLATNLVPGDTNAKRDVFLRDRLAGTTERVSVGGAGQESNDDSGDYGPSISADGRCVVFRSLAGNLVPNDVNGFADIFVRDRLAGTTEIVTPGWQGQGADNNSYYASISGDGRFVAVSSLATNLVPEDTNAKEDCFVRDRLTNEIERVSVASDGAQATNDTWWPVISFDGRYVVFSGPAANLVPNDGNGQWDVFIRDRLLHTTGRVSTGANGQEGNGPSNGGAASSGDGRYVVFVSNATNLVPWDTNGTYDVFVRDRGYVSIILDRTSAEVPEGQTATFDVRLDQCPADGMTAVSVERVDGDPDIHVSSNPQLLFTPQDWYTSQVVTVVAEPDADTCDGHATLRCSATGMPSQDVKVTELDRDPPDVDTDGDGVGDACDTCPNTPPGGVVDHDGCSVADFDRDADVDLFDFSLFQRCFGGPNRPPSSPDCGFADLDEDGDADLSDFSVFQGCFNGPNRPPACLHQ